MCLNSNDLLLYCTNPLLVLFAGSVQILYQENLGVIDFYPSNHTGVVYVNEADLVTATGYRRKLAKLRKVKSFTLVMRQFYPCFTYCIKGNFRPRFIFAPRPECEFRTGLI